MKYGKMQRIHVYSSFKHVFFQLLESLIYYFQLDNKRWTTEEQIKNYIEIFT